MKLRRANAIAAAVAVSAASTWLASSAAAAAFVAKLSAGGEHTCALVTATA